MMRRLTDILFSIVSLLLLTPVVLLICIVLRLSSRDPVIYIQERVGRGGRLFRLYKFRTMRAARQPGEGSPLTVRNDPRVTRLGRLLRRLRFDEIPQLFNIMKGDMTIVGPRPEVPRYVEQYKDWMTAVLDYKPGLTDPASLEYRRESGMLVGADDPESFYVETILPAKLRISLEYQSKRTIISDMKVILRTTAIIIGL
jgi:lipopolysaccharide/colanic/teichoic acid biosynthesis glycosyltransferase